MAHSYVDDGDQCQVRQLSQEGEGRNHRGTWERSALAQLCNFVQRACMVVPCYFSFASIPPNCRSVERLYYS